MDVMKAGGSEPDYDWMNRFGYSDPKRMPGHFFRNAEFIDYSTTARADTSRQDFVAVPRCWYINCGFHCVKCRRIFTWTAREQKAWFEDYNFHVDATPQLCKACRADEKRLLALRKEYDATVADARDGGSIGSKRRIIEILTELQAVFTVLPERMQETLRIFQRQVE